MHRLEKLAFCQVFMYSLDSNPLQMTLHQTNCMPNTIMAQGLDSMSTNNLLRSVTQYSRVLYHRAHIRR